ncbi:g4998 [Coccomyxa viridis]|uniref:G4998 protein n=1 Tax=Coccomyxa viridis TaxID=1274662 RepID=A0ABP1FRP3_9CHLO
MFQLPSEPTYFLDNRLPDQGKTWALKRIQHACKLNLTVSAQSDDQHDALSDGARAMKQASEGLTRLNALHLDVTHWPLQVLSTSGSASFMELCQPWVQKLLLGAGRLAALSTHLRTIPRPPIKQLPHLWHLEVSVSLKSDYGLDMVLDDVSRCRSLESLGIVFDASKEAIGLPSMYLQGMPRLKHVRVGSSIDKQIIYVVLSTNKEMAENWSPVICSCDSASRKDMGVEKDAAGMQAESECQRRSAVRWGRSDDAGIPWAAKTRDSGAVLSMAEQSLLTWQA